MPTFVDAAGQLVQGLWNAQGLGTVAQSGNPNAPARSNRAYLGPSSNSDGALAATGIMTSVQVPVCTGDVITTVSLPIGATAGATVTHGFAAIYSGLATPALLAQSTDIGATAAITHQALFSFTLATPVTVTEANAPGGFLYVSIMFAQSAGTIPTAVGVTLLATAAQYAWYTGAPLFDAATHGSALTTTAPATIVTPSVKAFAPYVVLT